MPLIDGADEYADLLWIDIEASGFGADSFPIEIGWCGVSLEPTSFLIRPLSKWTVEVWSPSSEKIHGISRQTLIECGRDACDVAHWLNAAAAGETVLSDSPGYDDAWLRQLFYDTGIVQEFELIDAVNEAGIAAGLSRLSQGEADSLLARIHQRFPHPHRAGPDSRRAAAEFMVLAMPWALQEIEDQA